MVNIIREVYYIPFNASEILEQNRMEPSGYEFSEFVISQDFVGLCTFL